MPYIRLSLARPRDGKTIADVEAAFRDIAARASGQEGCVASYLLRPHDDSGEVARVAIWRDERAAEHAAADETIMAFRSELDLVVDPRSHQERAFFSVD